MSAAPPLSAVRCPQSAIAAVESSAFTHASVVFLFSYGTSLFHDRSGSHLMEKIIQVRTHSLWPARCSLLAASCQLPAASC